MRPCCHRLSFVFWPDLFWNFSYKLCSFIKINWNVYYIFLSHRTCCPMMCRGRRLTSCFGSEYISAFYESLSHTTHTHYEIVTVLWLQIAIDILTVVFLSSAVVITTANAYFWKLLETRISFFFSILDAIIRLWYGKRKLQQNYPPPYYLSHSVPQEEVQYCERS